MWILILLFGVLYLLLSYFNRLAADDFYFLEAQKQWGAIKSVKQFYYTYSGRWMAYALTCALLQFSTFKFFLCLFSIVVLAFFVYAVHSLLASISLIMGIVFNFKERICYSFLLTISFFYSCFDVGETWFWYTSVCSYLISLIALLLLISTLLSSKRSILTLLKLILLALYIGGASESFACVSILVLLLFLIFSLSIPLKSRFNKIHRIKIVLALLILLASFGLTLMAPGNAIRLGMLPHPSFLQQVISPFKSLAKLGFLFFTQKFWILILFSFPWFILGNQVRINEPIELIALLKKLKSLAVIIPAICFILLFPANLILTETPPVRALSQLSFLLSLVFSWSFFYAGKQVRISDSWLNKIKIITWLLSACFLIYSCVNQYKVAGNYAQKYDMRMEELSKLKEDTSAMPILLEKLPKSGMLYSAELSIDSAHFSNQQLQKALHVKRWISRKE